MKIVVSPFALKRHWERPSPFTSVEVPPEQVCRLAEIELLGHRERPGYREGVVLVSIDPAGILSPVHLLAGLETSRALVRDRAEVRFDARREGEMPYLHHVLVGVKKTPARHVEVVLYSAAVLAEDNDRSDPEADWEVVSINARTADEPEPMTPMAMARNMLGLMGGTKAEYTAEEFARSIVYWSNHVMVEG